MVNAKKTDLSHEGKRLLTFLVARLGDVKPGHPETYVSYKEVHDALALDQEGETFGDSLKVQGLSSLADWTEATGKPAITGLIVERATKMPGEGYFKLFGRSALDFEWWKREIEKSKAFDWAIFFQEPDADGDSAVGWSDKELADAVAAYMEMQSLERKGKAFTKKKTYDDLAAKHGRSSKAFEYRMQNISYVLSLMGRDWISGLKPARNVGASIGEKIQEILSKLEGRDSISVVSDEITVREKVGKATLARPTGAKNPSSTISSITQYRRDLAVRAWVLKSASGICDCCKSSAPFSGPDGFPYLEVHHVRKLADRGSDTPENAVALCPNCHRELHYGANAKKLVEKLYATVSRLVRE